MSRFGLGHSLDPDDRHTGVRAAEIVRRYSPGLARVIRLAPETMRGALQTAALCRVGLGVCTLGEQGIVGGLMQRWSVCLAGSSMMLLAGMLAPPNMGEDYAAAFNVIYPELAAKYQIPLYPFFLDQSIVFYLHL